MLTGMWNRGEMVMVSPRTAPADSVEVHQVKTWFEVRFMGAVLSMFDSIDEANSVAGLVSRVLCSDSSETYAQRYCRTTEWAARHIAQDLMETNGKDAQVTASDERRIAAAETVARGEEKHLEAVAQMIG